MNVVCIQSEKIKEEIIELNKKLHGLHEQLILARQNTLKIHDKLNWKSHYDFTLISSSWKKQEIDLTKRLNSTDSNK